MVEKKKHKKDAKTVKPKLKSIEKQVLVLFIVLIIIFGGFLIGIKISERIKAKANTFEYKEFTVHKARLEGTIVDFYFIPIQVAGGVKTNLMFRTDPRELENLTVELNDSIFKKIKRVWITTNPEYDSDAIIAAGEIGRLTTNVDITTGYALTEEIGEFPKKTCEDATSTERVVDIRLGNQTKIYSEGNCIIVEAESNSGMIRAADKLAYYWFEQLFIRKIDF